MEFELLSVLLQHPGVVYSREDLLKYCWPMDTCVLDRTVDVVQIVRSILDDTALSLQQKGIAARLPMPQQVIIAAIQEYANMVSIGRLGLNDHGPVHMKTVCRNALKMLSLLHTAGMQTSLEKENIGTFADSVAAVMLASLLHDSGMTIGRKGHELYSGIISYSIIEKVLSQLLPEDCDILRRTIIRSIAIEGIIGHMATHPQ